MSTLTLIRFTEKETDAFPARTSDARLPGDNMVERRCLEHMAMVPRSGEEIIVRLRCNIPGEPVRSWYGRKRETYIERHRTVVLKLDKVVHDLTLGLIELQCVFVREDAA